MTSFLSAQAQIQTQTQSYPVDIQKGLAVKYYHNGEKLNPRQLEETVKKYPDALMEMKIARRNLTISRPLIIIGVLSSFVTYIIYNQTGEIKVPLAVVGAGGILTGAIMSESYNKHARDAVIIYNRAITTSSDSRTTIQVGLSLNHIGLKVKF